MINDRIKAMVRDFNPQWEGKEAVLPPDYKRHIFPEIEKYLKTKQIIAILGLRRVGKTVLMKQVMKDLKGPKENIFYFLLDDIVVHDPDILEDILNYFLKTIAKKGKKYIFLDEIQKVPYWQDILKRFYDMREDMKFVVSGSASLQIKKSKESLAGRIFDFYLPILTFREFLELNGMETEKSGLGSKGLEEVYEKNINKKPLLEKMFLQYIYKGSFPEMARVEDDDIVRNYVKSSVIDKIVLEDIPSVFAVRKKDILFSVLEYCSRETSNLLDISNLASILKTNYQTARSYIFYLQNSFVIDIVYNHSKSIAKQLRKNKKIHVAHPSIAISMAGYRKDALNVSELMGKYVETAVFQHSKCLSERISFWRTPQKDEVDIILSGKETIPIEVKYQSQISPSDLKPLLKFMDLHGVKKGFMVTKDLLEKRTIDGKTIQLVPAWVFLMVV